MTMNEKTDDVNWTAFRYVANELAPAEASEFESRLGEDQAAREAVAQAVQHTSQIHASFEQQAVVGLASQERVWNQSASRAFVLAGSCLTLLLAVMAIRFATQPSPDVAVRSTDGLITGQGGADLSTELALAWAEAFDGDFEIESVSSNRNMDSLEGDISRASITDDDALVAPSWMLAALETMGSGINSDIELQE